MFEDESKKLDFTNQENSLKKVIDMSQINSDEQNVQDEKRKGALMKKHFIYFMILNILFIFAILHSFNSVLVSKLSSLETKCYLIGVLNFRYLLFQTIFTIWYIPSLLMSSLFACINGYLLYNSDFEKEFTI